MANETGLQGRPVADLIQQFFGAIEQWPVEPKTGVSFTQSQVRSICEHMSGTGDCLWHAQTIVMKWPVCHCAKCSPPIHWPSCRCDECAEKRRSR